MGQECTSGPPRSSVVGGPLAAAGSVDPVGSHSLGEEGGGEVTPAMTLLRGFVVVGGHKEFLFRVPGPKTSWRAQRARSSTAVWFHGVSPLGSANARLGKKGAGKRSDSCLEAEARMAGDGRQGGGNEGAKEKDKREKGGEGEMRA